MRQAKALLSVAREEFVSTRERAFLDVDAAGVIFYSTQAGARSRVADVRQRTLRVVARARKLRVRCAACNRYRRASRRA